MIFIKKKRNGNIISVEIVEKPSENFVEKTVHILWSQPFWFFTTEWKAVTAEGRKALFEWNFFCCYNFGMTSSIISRAFNVLSILTNFFSDG